jgi:hypothetical protein
MDRVLEFNNIMPIKNIPSVLEYGVLSHKQAAQFPHIDISMQDVQDKRDSIILPSGNPLHSYANVYFDARNPMMYKRRGQVENLCILKISIEVLSIPGTYISSQNASSKYTRFIESERLEARMLDLDNIYSRNWDYVDQIEKWRNASIKCAEVLVPISLPTEFILGAYTATEDIAQSLSDAGFSKDITINADKFFL